MMINNEKSEYERALEEYLAKGGVITKLGPDEQSDEATVNPWRRGRTKKVKGKNES